MIAALIGGIAANPWARAALRYGAIAFAVLLFLLSIRRTGERAGRMAERLETSEKINDVHARCWMPRLAVLAIAMSLLTGCATVGSEPRITTVCPPLVEYSREFQARADPSCEAGPNIVESRWVDTALRYCQNKLKC
jgi:hypothetical protein